jgi:beta-1,4-N-acetylglucosaminyltransferase
MEMIAFVTVGSTHFDALVDSVLSTPVLSTLLSKGFSKLIVQCGKTKLQVGRLSQPALEGLEIEIWDFKDSLDNYYKQADLVISHAGETCVPLKLIDVDIE